MCRNFLKSTDFILGLKRLLVSADAIRHLSEEVIWTT